MNRRASQIAGILATTLLIACGGGESGGNASPPSSAAPRQASRSALAQAADRHLELVLAVDGQGGCTFQWQGTPVDGSGLSALASTAMQQDIARQGGPRNIVSLPQVWIRGAATTPYHCLGGALRELQRGGAFLTRLILPTRSSDRELPFVVLELPQAIDEPPPPIEPVRNSITVTQEGAILWNEPQSNPFVPPPPPLPPPGGAIPGNGHGQQIDRATLRQYLDVVTQMQPMPETLLHPAPQARLQDVEMVFVTARMANLRGIVLIGGDLRTGQLFRIYIRFSLAGEMGS